MIIVEDFRHRDVTSRYELTGGGGYISLVSPTISVAPGSTRLPPAYKSNSPPTGRGI